MPDVVARGVRFHTQWLGPEGAPPVVMVHGMLTGNVATWYFGLGAALAVDHRVLMYDQRGHGRSQAPVTGYTLTDLAADLDAVAEGVGPAVLVGHSFGGVVALRRALDRPGAVRSVVAVDSFEPGGAASAGPEGDDVVDLGAVLAWGRQRRMRAMAERSSRGRTRRTRATAEQVLLGGTTLVSDLRRDGHLDRSALARLVVPVLWVSGDTSPFRAEVADLGAALPDASTERIDLPGGHALHLDCPERLAAAVLPFVARTRCPEEATHG